MTNYNAHGIWINGGVIHADGMAINVRSVSSVHVQHLNGIGGCLLLVGLCCLVSVFILPFQSEYSWPVRLLNIAVALAAGVGLLWWGGKANGHYTVVLQVDGSEERIFQTRDKRAADEVRDAVIRSIKTN